MITNYSRLYDLLYDAQAELLNAIEHLQEYVRLSNDLEAETYVVEPLQVIASRDHGFLANDLNLDDLLERVGPYEEEDEDEDVIVDAN